jgi:hypothetical protein
MLFYPNIQWSDGSDLLKKMMMLLIPLMLRQFLPPAQVLLYL